MLKKKGRILQRSISDISVTLTSTAVTVEKLMLDGFRAVITKQQTLVSYKKELALQTVVSKPTLFVSTFEETYWRLVLCVAELSGGSF